MHRVHYTGKKYVSVWIFLQGQHLYYLSSVSEVSREKVMTAQCAGQTGKETSAAYPWLKRWPAIKPWCSKTSTEVHSLSWIKIQPFYIPFVDWVISPTIYIVFTWQIYIKMWLVFIWCCCGQTWKELILTLKPLRNTGPLSEKTRLRGIRKNLKVQKEKSHQRTFTPAVEESSLVR